MQQMQQAVGIVRIVTVALALAAAAPLALAQRGAFGAGYGPPLAVVPPPREFATSDEHYAYLLEQAKGGTKHTIASVPRVGTACGTRPATRT